LYFQSGSGGDSEEGVSAEVAFKEYDRDESGEIDASELQLLLKDLGVEPSEERLRAAFEELDKNGDGVISFEGDTLSIVVLS
jgi:Ca2+-binding EF-hand superfamily protein